MKKLISILTVFILFSFQVNQTDPVITVKLPLSDWQTVVYIIDNAAVSGEVRKPLITKIQSQAQEQLKDTSKQKGKN